VITAVPCYDNHASDIALEPHPIGFVHSMPALVD
jgi:hypothetical protein